MKQTVEEASAQSIATFKIDDNYDDYAYAEGHHKGFLRGAAWQKEQGIEWFPVNELPTMVFESAVSGGFKHSATVLIFSEDNGINQGSVGFYDNDSQQYWVPFTPTHWAYINLPK